jgi:hypothetical protein
VAFYVQLISADELKHQIKMGQLNNIMRNLLLPSDVRKKVRDYYGYMWNVHSTLDTKEEEEFLSELSLPLRAEVAVRANEKLVNNCWIFYEKTTLSKECPNTLYPLNP